MSILFQCGNTTEGGGSSEPKIIPKQCPRFLKFSCFAKNMKILEVHRRPLPTPNSVIQDSDASNLKYRISNNTLCYILSGLTLICELNSLISTNQCFCPGPEVCFTLLQPVEHLTSLCPPPTSSGAKLDQHLPA